LLIVVVGCEGESDDCRRKGEKIKKDGEHHMHLKRYGEQWSLGHPKVESAGRKLAEDGKCRG
jgi:hypothetical protein